MAKAEQNAINNIICKHIKKHSICCEQLPTPNQVGEEYIAEKTYIPETCFFYKQTDFGILQFFRRPKSKKRWHHETQSPTQEGWRVDITMCSIGSPELQLTCIFLKEQKKVSLFIMGNQATHPYRTPRWKSKDKSNKLCIAKQQFEVAPVGE